MFACPLHRADSIIGLGRWRFFLFPVTLCAAYAGVVLVQGATKLGLNVYRGWVGEKAIRDLRRRVLAYLRIARVAAPGPEAAVSRRR
jgi:hypothetical protein